MNDVGGAAAIVGAPVAVIAGVLLGPLRDRTGGVGRANDVASVVFALLLVPVAVAADAGEAWTAVTAAGLAAMAVAAVASGLTAAGRPTVAQLTVWQGGAFAALFVWVAGASAERAAQCARLARDRGRRAVPSARHSAPSCQASSVRPLRIPTLPRQPEPTSSGAGHSSRRLSSAGSSTTSSTCSAPRSSSRDGPSGPPTSGRWAHDREPGAGEVAVPCELF